MNAETKGAADMFREKIEAFVEDKQEFHSLLILVGLVAVLTYSFWNSLAIAADGWNSPQYSHGWLVPLFGIVLLVIRAEPLRGAEPSAIWAGAGLIALGCVIRLLAAQFYFILPDMGAYLPCLAGAFLIAGGWKTVRWAWPVVAFLVFMFPLPNVLERGLLTPLQGWATGVSTFALQTLGLEAYREGNIINIKDVEMGVVDACAGLRMLTIFVALAVGITLISKRPWWEQAIIILSAGPIALLVNVIRITVTGVLHVVADSETANIVFHDLAGWLMPPMALGFLYLELQLLSRLVVEEESIGDSMPFDISGAPV